MPILNWDLCTLVERHGGSFRDVAYKLRPRNGNIDRVLRLCAVLRTNNPDEAEQYWWDAMAIPSLTSLPSDMQHRMLLVNRAEELRKAIRDITINIGLELSDEYPTQESDDKVRHMLEGVCYTAFLMLTHREWAKSTLSDCV